MGLQHALAMVRSVPLCWILLTDALYNIVVVWIMWDLCKGWWDHNSTCHYSWVGKLLGPKDRSMYVLFLVLKLTA
jgi:hypothetical protein